MVDIIWFIAIAVLSFLVFSSPLWWPDWSEYWWPKLRGEKRWKSKSMDGHTIYYRTSPDDSITKGGIDGTT